MSKNAYENLDNEQLLIEKEKMKTRKLLCIIAIIASFVCFGVVAINIGMSFFTFLPLAFAFLAMKIMEKMHALEAALSARGLE